VVKDRLGHGSIVATQNYLHTLPGADESALKAISAEQLAEYEALEKEKQAGRVAQAVVEVGGEQLVVSAEEHAELEQLRTKMEAMKAAFAS
jgi:hypothetical protein